MHITFASDPRAVWNLYGHFGGQLAFDVGANGGLLAKIFAYRFRQVVACEPAEESYVELARTAGPRVVPLQVAVSDHNGEVTLSEWSVTEQLGELVTGDSMASSWGDPVGVRTVPCVTLDSLTETYGRPDFVKIDTEGHEAHIIRGAEQTFSDPVQFVIEIHSAENGQFIQGWLDEHEQPWHPIFYYSPESAYRNRHYWIASGGA